MELTIKRVAAITHGTFGVLFCEGIPFALTLERPWRDNKKRVSCIPAGQYLARRCRKSKTYGYADSPRFGDTFVVENVPGRSNILFHKGNLVDDSHGCILVGEQFGVLNGDTAVLASSAGFEEFLRITASRDDFTLFIEDVT